MTNIAKFEFEARKDVVQIFNNLLRRQIGTRHPTVEYISGKHDVIFATLAGYENEEIALNTGMILKEMLKSEQLAKILLYSDKCVVPCCHLATALTGCRFYNFPNYIETTTFGISCDAFANLKETLTRHKSMVAEYLDKNYDRVGPLSFHSTYFADIFLSVLCLVYYPYTVRKLCHQATVFETPGRDPPGPRQL